MLHIAVFLADHIHMCLKDNALVLLVARCGRLAHDDIHCLIDGIFDMVLAGKILQPLRDTLLVFGGARNLVYLGEDVEYFARFEVIHVLFRF